MKKWLALVICILLSIGLFIPKANTKQISKSDIQNIEKSSLKYENIEYSTYLGGLGPDWVFGVTIDKQGNVYLTGLTHSIKFPIKNTCNKHWNLINIIRGDIFVTKISNSSNSLEYSTLLGGSYADYGVMMEVDDKGAVYICGNTKSKDFPVENQIKNSSNELGDIFVIKLSPSEDRIIYSTLIGGSDEDKALDLAVDKKGSVYVTGRTKSKDFPTKKPYDSTHNGSMDAFLLKLSAEGDKLNFSTFIGGSRDDWGYGIDVDSSENILISGNTSSPDFPLKNAFDNNFQNDEAYIMKINPLGDSINFSTFLGGNQVEKGWGLTLDEQGYIYICGNTNSTDFPIKNPVQKNKRGKTDIYITKISPKGDELIYSTYLGGNSIDDANRIAVDQQGCVYFTGYTTSSDFPVMNPFDGTYNGEWDSYVVKLSPEGNKLLYSTYLGGRNRDDGYHVAVDNDRCFYVTGYTYSSNFPTKNSYDRNYNGFMDCFLVKFSPAEYNPIQEVKGGGHLSVALNSNESSLNWSIIIKKNLLPERKINGTINPYSYEEIKLKSIMGFGKTNIKISTNGIEKVYSAFLLGSFFINVRPL